MCNQRRNINVGNAVVEEITWIKLYLSTIAFYKYFLN